MAIDPYSPCPCGSGKKLKFCCSDLAADIEKVYQKISAEQPHAALKQVEQLLQKQPERASLLDLRASIELSLHDLEAARKSIEAFVAAHPKSSTANAQWAVLAAAEEKGSDGISALQDALENLSGDDMPLRVLEAIGAVGQALLLEGDFVAARGHLLLYAAIAPEGDNLALELLLRMNLQAGLPLLMREYLLMEDCPDGVTWQAQFDQASRLSARGQWRRAEQFLAKLREEVGALPEIVYNLALTRGWLGQSDQFAAGLHEYASLDVPTDNAVEAEALAQLVDPEIKDPTVDTVKLTYPITDVDTLAERLAADKRVEVYPLDPQNYADEATMPRSTHVLLDRPTPATGGGIQRTEVPNVVAFLSVYGKRTDREARLEVTTDRDDGFEKVQSLVSEIAADAIQASADEEILTQKSISEEALSWRWRLPDDTPPEHRRKLLAEQRREAILNRWTSAPRAALAGKSPQEAVGKQSLRIALLASALIIEQAAVEPDELPLFEELRERLQLPVPEAIDPTRLDLEHLPVVRVPRLELSKVADADLAKLLDRTVLMGANLATQIVASELVGREQLAEGVDPAPAYRQLIRLEADNERAFAWLAKARAWSRSRGQSEAEWALIELQSAIERGESEKLRSVLHEIHEKHLEEKGVGEATYRILADAGLLPAPDTSGRPSHAASQAVAHPHHATESQTLWTPDDSTADESPEGEKKSVIWTP